MELQRKAAKRIEKWFQKERNALLVRGARQVGKTFLIRQVLSSLGCNVIEINLIDSPEMISVLEQSRTVDDLILGFSTAGFGRPVPSESVIFIDEVQKYKDMITRIKFLVEEGSFRYILSGSLLGIELTGLSSAPVGYLSILDMFPLDFEEFLQTANISEESLSSLRDSFFKRKPVLDAVNEKMLTLFTRYLMIGGMPAAVSRFAETNNIEDVISIHKELVSLYKMDFTRYEQVDRKLLISNTYDLVPSELLKQNKRFIVSDLKKGLHYERVESTFLWLENAGVVITAYNATEPRVPLRLNEKHSLFKLYLADVGLLTSIYGMATKRMLFSRSVNLNAGGIYENAIAQELYSRQFPIYYYNSNRLGELDFVIEYEGKILPIEVKSGKDYTIHSAINNCLENKEFGISEAFVLSNCNIERRGKVTYLPIYMAMFITQDSYGDFTLPPLTF
ncbi:MAG: ATP-binding protein [Lachnospiraceae bacterium]|nr:ATP-binding protein [Lachnospiraceae bacterium]